MHSMSNIVRHVNVTVPLEEIEQQAVNIVRQVRPEWTNNEVSVQHFTEGLTNSLVCCFRKSSPKDGVLVRVYGEKTELFIDRDLELRHMVEMNKVSFGPPVYCTFNNGVCYGYESGKVLSPESLKDGNLSRLIAEKMAQMHSLKVGYEDERSALLAPLLQKVFSHCSDFGSFKCPFGSRTFTKEDLQREVDFVEKHVPNARSNIVFCHNDLLSKNILYDQTDESVKFIDYEYAGYNYQAFDLANHFCEFAGHDRDYEKFPDEQFQRQWVTNYVLTWNHENPANKLEVENFYKEVCAFVPTSDLLWGIWALVQSQYSKLDFDFENFAAKLIGHYYETKENLNMLL